MALYRATVTLTKTNGVANDAVQNVWHIASLAGADPHNAIARADIATSLAAFYAAMDEHLSDSIRTTVSAHTVEVADLVVNLAGAGDDAVDSPAEVVTFTTPIVSASAALPSEVAVVLSMNASFGSLPEESAGTRPRSRRRGRVYLPPMSSAIITTADGEPRPSAAFITDTLNKVEAMHVSLEADGLTPVVYSRVNGSALPVVNYSIDNAFDIQRRRGPRPTVRTNRSV